MPLHSIRRLFAPSRRNPPEKPRRRPGLESLEDRCTPTVAGYLDPSFSNDGKVSTGIYVAGVKYDLANAVVAQPDGKVVVVGNTNNDMSVVRYNRDGTVDFTYAFGGTTFGGSNFAGTATSVALQPDGKVVIGGYRYGPNGQDFVAWRLTPSGQLDPTFDADGMQVIDLGSNKDDYAFDVAVQADGKIVLAGQTYTASDRDFGVVRLNPDGSLDTSFGQGGIRTIGFDLSYLNNSDTGQSVVIQPDGKIVVGGTATTGYGFLYRGSFALARLNPNGALDDTFGSRGKAVYDVGDTCRLNDLAVGPDGKLVMVGDATIGTAVKDYRTGFAVVRALPNGSLDTSYNYSGSRITYSYVQGGNYDVANAVVVQPDGKIVVAGTVDTLVRDNNDMLVARFNIDGSEDKTFGDDGSPGAVRTAFDIGGSKSDEAYGVALTPDGIVVVGRTTVASNDTDFAIYRLVRDPKVFAGGFSGAPMVQVTTPTGTPLSQFLAFPASMRGEVRVATEDITDDGKPEVFAALGEGGPPLVRIFDGGDFHLIRQILVHAPRFRGGVNLAVAEALPSHAGPELVVSFGRGSAPVVKFYDHGTGAFLKQMTVFESRYLGGVQLTTADVNGDETDEVVVAKQDGSSPQLRLIDGQTGALLSTIRVANAPIAGGFHLASGNVNGRGGDDLVVGFGSGAGLVKVFEGLDGALLKTYQAFGPKYRGGVHVGAYDVDGDGYADVLTAALVKGIAPRYFLS